MFELRAQPDSCYTVNVETAAGVAHGIKRQGLFYGWYIVGVGFLANVASSFALASTLSIFLKPLTTELGVSRGVFSLLRSGEGIIGACLAPLVGTLVDRYGGRWLMAIGAIVVGVGYFFLGHVDSFNQFAAIRLTLVSCGDAVMGYMVVNVVIAQWFVRRRGRALAFTSMGVGFAKVCMPVVAAWLLLTLGWRQTWTVFGVLTIALLVLPALFVIRRPPEDMNLYPDGSAVPVNTSASTAKKSAAIDSRQTIGCGLDARRSRAHQRVLVARRNLWHFEHGSHRTQSACFCLCDRYRSFSRGRGYGDERDRVDAARFTAGLGPACREDRPAHRSHVAIRDPGHWIGIGDIDGQSFLSLCRFFSLRHRSRRQYGFAGYSLGELFRPPLARQDSRHGLADLPGIGGSRSAVFRISIRCHRRLRPLLCAVRRSLDDFGGTQPHAETAAESIIGRWR